MKKSYDNAFKAVGFNEEMSQNLKIKNGLILEIKNISISNKYSQHDLSKILDVPQSRISELMTGKIDKFSTDKLIIFLSKLGRRITFHSQEEERQTL